jgi:ribonuclease HI
MSTPPADAWLAWFDGSSHPNPGRMGIGGLLQSPDGRIVEISCAAGYGDSSEAEYLALNAVLDAAVAAQPAHLVIHGDSQVVIDDICSKRRPAVLLTEQRERALRSIAQLENVAFIWIPRHKNAHADALSQRAVRHASGHMSEDIAPD